MRYPLDAMRGIAALVVVSFHAYQFNRSGPDAAWPWSGGAHQLMTGSDLFVDLFFVLSGLVLWVPIATAALDGRAGRGGRHLLWRRMARLLPLYLTIVLVVWALTNPRLPGHWVDLVTHLTFTHVYSDQYIFWTDGPAWSLAVEFHFYVLIALIAPLLYAVCRRASPRARLIALWTAPLVLVATGLVYLTWAYAFSGAAEEDWSIWFSPLAKATDFGLGMGLGLLAVTGVRLGPWVARACASTALVALGVLVMTRPLDQTVGNWWHPLYAAAVVLGLAAIVLTDRPAPRALTWTPLAQVGALAYGVYLLHEPVMRMLGHYGLLPTPQPGAMWVLTAALVAVPTIALAWVSSRTLEAAGLRLLAMTERGSDRPREYYPHLTASAA